MPARRATKAISVTVQAGGGQAEPAAAWAARARAEAREAPGRAAVKRALVAKAALERRAHLAVPAHLAVLARVQRAAAPERARPAVDPAVYRSFPANPIPASRRSCRR